jgi:hypothetical protein
MNSFKEIVKQWSSDSYNFTDASDVVNQSYLILLFIKLKNAGLKNDDDFIVLGSLIMESIGQRLRYDEHDLKISNLLSYLLAFDLMEAKDSAFKEIDPVEQNIESENGEYIDDGDIDPSDIEFSDVNFDEEYGILIGYKNDR